MTNKINLLLVGAGKMGGAMLQRWETFSLCDCIYTVDPAQVSSQNHRVMSLDDLPHDFKPDTVVFAVKPQTLPDIISSYRAYAESGAVMLSIAAGKTVSFFENALGENAKVIRAMPNTPASVGKGITVAIANKNVTAREKEQASALLGAVGDVLWIEDESQMNAVTALSGSGPAYVFLLMEVMAEAGKRLGLDANMAEKLARQTVIGSAALAEVSPDIDSSTLRNNVTSPGGTTAAALAVLMRRGDNLQTLFDDALKAAHDRSFDLMTAKETN